MNTPKCETLFTVHDRSVASKTFLHGGRWERHRRGYSTHLRGAYLVNSGNPRGPNFNDIRAGVWYAFSH